MVQVSYAKYIRVHRLATALSAQNIFFSYSCLLEDDHPLQDNYLSFEVSARGAIALQDKQRNFFPTFVLKRKLFLQCVR